LPRMLNAEKLAYWYLRLNGFMTTENFILHDKSTKGIAQRTDADIYGVRFPFREELKMKDDELFRTQDERPVFIIAEVKSGECTLNGPWTNIGKENIQYVLRAIGAFKPSIVEEVAAALYKSYMYEDQQRKITLLAIGSRVNQEYLTERPELRQLLFRDMIQFIYRRFREFRMQKRDHKQWDSAGSYLYAMTDRRKENDFVDVILREAGLENAQ
jgi:hypothetical protein